MTIEVVKSFRAMDSLKRLLDNPANGRWQERILSELKFVCILSERDGGKFDAIIEKARLFLEDAYENHGAITKCTVEQAEQILLPAVEEAKSYKFLCVAHAHIDMNWMWGFDETTGVTVDTFRTMLNIMKEYPDYKFSQSQASVYKIVEEYDPGMLEEIKEMVHKGRWEITASTWVETDKNMPSGESLSRHILYTKDYISKTFGIAKEDLEIDFEPDTFGHNKNVPEILAQGGIHYYYHCRGHVGDKVLYRWHGPSGSEVVLYTEPFWYNATIDNRVAEYAVDLQKLTGSKTLLKVYGVGDHGGGPTRRDVEKLIEMDSWPVYPQFKFSTLREYFKTVDSRKDTLPVIEGEINFLCDGCYTTQTRIKAGNRKSEALLNEAELISTMSSVRTGSPYPRKVLSDAWVKTLFNQFHDIIPGSGVTETREYASGLHQQVFAAAQTSSKIAMRQITESIDTSSLIPQQDIKFSAGEGGGAGHYQVGRSSGGSRIYHLFNPSLHERKELTEIVVWDYEGNAGSITAANSEGHAVPSQIIGQGHYWGHNFTRLLIEAEVPPCGYSTYVISEKANYGNSYYFTNDMRVQYPDRFVLENDIVRAELNSLDGSLLSFKDKRAGEELADSKRPSCVFRLVHEAVTKAVTGWGGGMSAWFTGRYKKVELVNDNIEMKMVSAGPLRSAVQYQAAFGNSKLTVDVYLDKGSDSLQFNVECDWREFGGDAVGVPALHFCLPLNYHCDSYQFDVPFGMTVRKEMDMDLPANSFVMGQNPNGSKSLMLSSKTKYGYRCINDQIALTLIRGAYDPDPTPEIGKHRIQFAVKAADTGLANRDYIQQSYDYNHPLIVFSGTSHPGTLPLSSSLYTLESGSVMVSSVKMPESGEENALLLRMYETDGNSTKVRLNAGFAVKGACFVDGIERSSDNSPDICIDGSTLIFDVKPYGVANIMVKFGR